MEDGAGLILVYLPFMIFMIIVQWRIFEKAGKPGWASIIPFYNGIIWIKIAGHQWWLYLLFFIPIVNIIIMCIVIFDVALAFGKGTGFGFGMLFLPFIFFPILAFGNAEYKENMY